MTAIIARKPAVCVRCEMIAILDRAGHCAICQHEEATGKVYINWDVLRYSWDLPLWRLGEEEGLEMAARG